MTAKVFISCGQAKRTEKLAATKVGELLANEFGLKPYVAFRVQSLDDIMIITKELRSSDYYLFIDFKRLSIFTHQELALAHHLAFGGDIIALRQAGSSRPEGFLRYVLSNPTEFDTTDNLLELVRELVKTKGWNPQYSRNLVVNPLLKRSGAIVYSDHSGQSLHEVWTATIENHRLDAAAVGATCILDSIQYPSGDRRPCIDSGYLKWALHNGYERTILPNRSNEVALFAVRHDKAGLFLTSSLDVIPRDPIVTENGDYELAYKLFARDFPLLEFTVIVHLRWQAATPMVWTHQSEASLKT